jgi:hypothetical protein
MSNEDLVRRTFRKYKGREPTSAEVRREIDEATKRKESPAQWSARIAAHYGDKPASGSSPSPGAVGSRPLSNEELVRLAYRRYLKRDPTAAEIKAAIADGTQRGENQQQWADRVAAMFGDTAPRLKMPATPRGPRPALPVPSAKSIPPGGYANPWDPVVQDLRAQNPDISDGEIWRRYTTGAYVPQAHYAPNPWAPHVVYVAPVKGAAGTPEMPDLSILTEPVQRDAEGQADPTQAARRAEVSRQIAQSAKIIPGAAPNLGVLPDGSVVDLISFSPVATDKLSPTDLAFAKLALRNPNAPMFSDVQDKLDLQGRGYVYKGEPSAEEVALMERFTKGDLSAAEPLAHLRMGRLSVRPRDDQGTRDILIPIIIGGIVVGLSAGFGAAASPFVGPIAGAAVGGAAGSASGAAISTNGDPDAIWKAALLGGATGAAGAAIPSTGSVGPDALRGAAIGAGGSALQQGLSGDEFDWVKFLQAAGTGGATGAAGALTAGPRPGDPGFDPNAGTNWPAFLAKFGTGVSSNIFRTLLADPPDGNAQISQDAITREQDRAAEMQARQEEWKRRYSEASAEHQRLMQEQWRAAQMEFESKKAEYQTKLQAFLDERKTQIEDALRAMGLAEPGIAGLLADRQKQMDARRAEEESQRAALVESRNFFPSQLLSQTGDTGASGLLVPHSPPSVLFGEEGMPASFGDYGAAPAPQFSGEGFLPSGALPDSPPSVAPMGQNTRSPRYFPTLLNGLTRSPYLRYA